MKYIWSTSLISIASPANVKELCYKDIGMFCLAKKNEYWSKHTGKSFPLTTCSPPCLGQGSADTPSWLAAISLHCSESD